MVVDQSTRHGSAAAVIAAEVASEGFSSLKAPVQLVCALDATIPYSEPMEQYLLPDAAKIAAAVLGSRRCRHRPSTAAPPRDVADPRLRGAGRPADARERGARARPPPTGQEAVAVGVCSQLRDDDVVYSGHRAHGHALAKGAPMGPLMAELMGRDTGLCRGLGGSMHVVDREHGFLGATGVVGGNVPLALGSALAARLSGSDAVAVVFFGDGAVQGGIFVESVNIAALWQLPVILVCENNGFAEFTPRSAHTVVERVSDVVAPYGFPRETVDGNDVHAVREAFGGSSRKAREGRRPVPARVPDPPARRPLRGRPAALPRGDRRRGVAGDRPDPPARRRRGPRGGGARRGRGGGRVRAREPVPAGRAHRAAGVRLSTTYLEAITATLAEAMRADARVLVLGEDVAEGGPWGATAGLAEEFGAERVRNTPISEAAIAGIAIGAAQSGLRPVVEIMFVDFVTLALDQLVNQAAKAHFMSGGQLTVPLVLRTQGGAGQRGGAQHSQSLEAWLTHVPGLKVVMPATAADAAGLLRAAIADPNPVVYVENKTLYFRREEPDARGGADRPRPGRPPRPRRHGRRAFAPRPRGASPPPTSWPPRGSRSR